MNVKFNWTEVVRFECSLESLWPWISVFGFIINLPVSVHIPEGYVCELDRPLTSWFSVIQEKIWESKCVQMQMRFPHTKKTTVFNLSSACTCILSVKFKYRNIVRNTCKTVFKKLFFYCYFCVHQTTAWCPKGPWDHFQRLCDDYWEKKKENSKY